MTIVTPWAVDVKPEFGEELEVERNSVQTDNCWEVDQHFVDRVLRCVILVLVWMLILFVASWWDDVDNDYISFGFEDYGIAWWQQMLRGWSTFQWWSVMGVWQIFCWFHLKRLDRKARDAALNVFTAGNKKVESEKWSPTSFTATLTMRSTRLW